MIRQWLLSLFIISLCGCSMGGGTDTGNPNHNGQVEEFFASDIRAVTCLKLVNCHSDLTMNECTSAYFELDNLDEEFGLVSGEYANFEMVYRAERNGDLIVNSIESASCKKAVSDLTCDDPRVIEAYRFLSTNPFEKVANLYAPVCADVYSKK